MLVFCINRRVSARIRGTDGTSWGTDCCGRRFRRVVLFSNRSVSGRVAARSSTGVTDDDDVRGSSIEVDDERLRRRSNTNHARPYCNPVSTAHRAPNRWAWILTDITFVGSERKNRSGCRASSLSFRQSSECIVSPFRIESSSGSGSDSLRTRFNIVLEDSRDGSEFPERKQGMSVGTKESQKTELTDDFVLLAAAVTASRLARPSSKVRDRC